MIILADILKCEVIHLSLNYRGIEFIGHIIFNLLTMDQLRIISGSMAANIHLVAGHSLWLLFICNCNVVRECILD